MSAMTAGLPERRRHWDHPWYVLIFTEPFWFLFWPLTDKRGEGLSLTRILAAVFGYVDLHIMEITHSVSGNQLWLALACFAVAFGKSTFTFLLTRIALRSQSTQTDVKAEITQTIRTISERRDAGGGLYEPAP